MSFRLQATSLSDPLFVILFFFFKQKTAYEMRISDWSSDVCSSDLNGVPMRCMKLFLPVCLLAVLGAAGAWADMKVELKDGRVLTLPEIGRASCRERVCQYV